MNTSLGLALPPQLLLPGDLRLLYEMGFCWSELGRLNLVAVVIAARWAVLWRVQRGGDVVLGEAALGDVALDGVVFEEATLGKKIVGVVALRDVTLGGEVLEVVHEGSALGKVVPGAAVVRGMVVPGEAFPIIDSRA